MSGRWEHFAHGADVGIRGIGASLAEAFAQAALAMNAAVTDPETIARRQPVDIACAGRDVEDLLYAWLNAVIYEMATRHMLFGEFRVDIRDGTLRAVAWGEPVSIERHEPAVEIKGATFTALRVRQSGGQWIAECVVDV